MTQLKNFCDYLYNSSVLTEDTENHFLLLNFKLEKGKLYSLIILCKEVGREMFVQTMNIN